MRRFSVRVATAGMTAVLVGCGGAAPDDTATAGMAQSMPSAASVVTASADIQDPQGQSLGTATLTETPHGVLVSVDLSGVPAGEHALHLHAVGACEAPGFTSAGGHYNPESKSHGFKNAAGLHAGDLPNVHVGEDGMLKADAFADGVTLSAGATSLLDDDGTAIVVHSGPDDYESDPAGDAGSRIACGVVQQEG